MAKKIILGVLFLGLVGALAVGAVNRTVAKTNDSEGTAHHGAGWAAAPENNAVLAANMQGRGGQGSGRYAAQQSTPPASAGQAARGWQSGGHTPLGEQGTNAPQGQGGQGLRDRQGGGSTNGDRQGAGPIAATEDHEWVTVSGAVVSVDQTQMVVQTPSGEIVIADRPWSYAQAAGFAAEVGDVVTLKGFYEDETFEVGQLINGAQTVSIREESGRPLWAGSGRGRGRTW